MKDPNEAYLERRSDPSIRDKVKTVIANARVLGRSLGFDGSTDISILEGLRAAQIEMHERDREKHGTK